MPEAAKLVRTAQDALSLPDFIRAVGYGATVPAEPVDLALAGAGALRELLKAQGAGDDAPRRTWVVLGQVTNSVMAAHFGV